VAVNINSPQGDAYYGGQIAAPLFAEVMKTGLRLLNVPADLAVPETKQPELKEQTAKRAEDNHG